MAGESDYYDIVEDAEAAVGADPVAQRAEAYRRLLADVAGLPRGARDLREEGAAMLKALRLSFRAPQGELSVVRPSGRPS